MLRCMQPAEYACVAGLSTAMHFRGLSLTRPLDATGTNRLQK
jgi:hypothetical protein